MKKIIVLFICLFFTCISVHANMYCDKWGNCSGTTVNGERINTYTDRWGNTSGSIGNQRINTYTDRWGNTLGF